MDTFTCFEEEMFYAAANDMGATDNKDDYVDLLERGQLDRGTIEGVILSDAVLPTSFWVAIEKGYKGRLSRKAAAALVEVINDNGDEDDDEEDDED